MNIKILVCCHKKDLVVDIPPYLPIHVGKSLSNLELGITGDNSGENISEKNGSYCELTGIYWAWKNLKNVDAIGLCHYRRYFDFTGSKRLFPVRVSQLKDFDAESFALPAKVISRLDKGNVIAARSIHYLSNLFIDYCVKHYSDDIRTIESIILETTPAKYHKAFVDIMYKNNKLSPFNMFIMNWALFDKYCNWLFPVLKEAEKKIDISGYSISQKRIYGYVAERLLNVFLYAEEQNVKEYPVVYFNDNDDVRISRTKYLLNVLRSKIAIALTKQH